MKKKYVVMLAAMLACGILFTGCGKKDQSSDNNVPPVNNTGNVNGADDAGDVDDTNNTEDVDTPNTENADTTDVSDSGASGEIHDLAQNDVMHSVFFDLKVNSVETADELDVWVPTEGNVFLIVNVSITNTFGSEIPMSYADFPVVWNNGEDGVYPDSDFSIAFPEEYNIADGETQTGNLVYSIPQDLDEVVLEYYDLFSNGQTGDTFDLHISVN